MSFTQWSVSKLQLCNVFRFKFTTDGTNFIYADLTTPLTFDTRHDILSIRGSNRVRIHLVDSSSTHNTSIIIQSCTNEITTAGIGISRSAFDDITHYILNKYPIEHSYSD